MPKLSDIIKDSPATLFLGALVTGFSAGIGAYRTVLEVTNQETVIKDSYVLKKDLAGPILKTEAVREIEHLIEIGRNTSDELKIRTWLRQVLTFVHNLDLPKDRSLFGHKVSTVELDIRNAIGEVHEQNISENQVADVLGILNGLAASFRTKVAAE